MHLSTDPSLPSVPASSEDPIERELDEVEALRQRTLATRGVLDGSATARHLVEKELPRKLSMIRRVWRSSSSGAPMPSSEALMRRQLAELRQEVGALRRLIESH